MTSIDDMASEIMKGLQEYSELADTAMKKAVRKTATSVKKEISANAPNRTGKYAKSWTTKKVKENSHSLEITIALVTTDFATEILGQKLDSKGVLVESNDAEVAEFALFFEFEGDRHKIRHVMYRCSVARPATESATTEESTEVKTETLSLKASALPDGLVKSKTCENTDETTYNNWYKSVYIPTFATTKTTAKTTS